MLRVGILGAGQVGARHAIGSSHVSGWTIVGAADVVEDRANALAERRGGSALTNYRRMLDENLEAVVACLPHSMHREPAEEAAARGVHVLMEKPLATTLPDARRIISVSEEAGVKLAMGFVHRLREEVETAQQWMATGIIGAPQVGYEVMNGQRGSDLPDWVTAESIAGGGILMYNAIRAIDRLRFLELRSDHRLGPDLQM